MNMTKLFIPVLILLPPFTLNAAPNDPLDLPAVYLSETLANKLNKHESLPQRSPLGLSVLGESQESNTLSMAQLMETLAAELGSSKSLDLLALINNNILIAQSLKEKTHSSDPKIAEEARLLLKKTQQEGESLKEELKNILNLEGFNLQKKDVEDICQSPNAPDHASLLAAFHQTKKIAKVMEERLLANPCSAEAQKYYATQFILLACLDNIQLTFIKKIQETHIPKACALQKEARDTQLAAIELLKQINNDDNNSLILKTNIKTCEETIELAEKTQLKLEGNLRILQKSRVKTRVSLETAKNSHKTTLIKNELAQLETSHYREIEDIQNLLVPEMLAISFANPQTPEIVPRLTQREKIRY